MTLVSWASLNGVNSMAAKKKPRGFGKFDALTRKLVQVDKTAVDKRIEKDKAKRIKKRKKS